MESFEEGSVCAPTGSRTLLGCFPKLLLGRVTIHGADLEQAICEREVNVLRSGENEKHDMLPLNFLGGLAKSPASGFTTHLSSTNLQRRERVRDSVE